MIANAVAAMLIWASSHSPRHLTDEDKQALLHLVRDGSRVVVPERSFGCRFAVIGSTYGDVCVTETGVLNKLTPEQLDKLAAGRWSQP